MEWLRRTSQVELDEHQQKNSLPSAKIFSINFKAISSYEIKLPLFPVEIPVESAQ